MAEQLAVLAAFVDAFNAACTSLDPEAMTTTPDGGYASRVTEHPFEVAADQATKIVHRAAEAEAQGVEPQSGGAISVCPACAELPPPEGAYAFCGIRCCSAMACCRLR